MLTALVANIISNLMSSHSFYGKKKDLYIDEIEEEDKKELPNPEAEPA